MTTKDGKLMNMLVGYAAAHQHPLNVLVHMVGIPTIMLGVLIPLSWLRVEIGGFPVTAAHFAMFGFFVFYLTLDTVFAAAFLIFALLVAQLAGIIGALPVAISGGIAAAAFFGGYAAQFIGHAVEKSQPVLIKHPVQANLAAPFFQIVEMFKIMGLRDELFNELQRQVEANREVSTEVSG